MRLEGHVGDAGSRAGVSRLVRGRKRRERETNGVSRRIAPTEVTAGVTDQRTIMQNRVSLSVVCVT
jgi:hypothetical protein